MKLETDCLVCGTVIQHYSSEPRKTCSRRCKGIWWSQQDNPKKVKTSPKECALCNKEFSRKYGCSIKIWKEMKFCSRPCYWKSKVGEERPIWVREKLSKARSGEKNHNWKGGTSGTERHREMGRRKYAEWRTAVFKRDDFTCQFCGKRGVELNADHIKRWSDYPELRYELSNGRTLCVPCHKTTGTWGYNSNIQLSKDNEATVCSATITN